MTKHEVHVNFEGRIVFVGFGSIGQGILPLILRHIGTSADRITILTAEDAGHEEADHFGVTFIKTALTRDNYRRTLEPLLSAGDFLLNLSVDVSSVALVELARERGALYLDTCIEPWAGGYVDPNASVESRSNYTMRLDALKLRNRAKDAPTAVLTHGANPGLVSHLVKQALMNIAKDTEVDATAASGNLDPVTLAYLPPKTSPRGVITLPANFDKPGKYAVLVTVRDAKDMAMSGRLGLTVGEASRQWIFVYILSGIILAAAFGFYLRDLGRNKKTLVKSG